MLFANCHMHSKFSDGEYMPEALVELAQKIGHKALVLTDHDTIRGTYFLQKEARKRGLLSMLGCEFSTKSKALGTGFHLVGFDFNPYNKKMVELLAYASAKQTSRSKFLFEEGQKRGTLRKGVTWQEVLEYRPYNDYFCNNQVFDLYVERGIYEPQEYNEFFTKNFLTKNSGVRGAEIERITGFHTPELEDVINIILESGGVPVIAHPNEKEDYVEKLVNLGIKGFETRHPDLKEGEPEYFDKVCDKYKLYKSGGTDHSSILGGLTEKMPEHNLPTETGYVTEEDFMKLYRRELG